VVLVVPEYQEGIENDVDDVFEFYGVPESFEIVKLRQFRPLKFWYSTVMANRAIRLSGAELFHTRILWTAWGLSTIFRKPTILELHEVPVLGSLEPKCFRSITKRRSLEHVVTITNALKQRLLPDVGRACRFVIAPDGVDGALVDSTLSRDEARDAVGLPNDSQLLALYAGHLYQGRGIEVIVQLAARCRNIKFVIVGGRDEDIRHWRSQVGELENVYFAGFVAPQRVFHYLRAADVLLMPHAKRVMTSGRGDIAEVCSPMKMFEYMAAGKPILASELPVLQEVLRPESNCLIAPYDELDRWESQLQRLNSDAELRMRLGNRARRDARQYTWESRAAKVLDAALL
jgi:glycosyltransferase involved in cell wall biosynthesis